MKPEYFRNCYKILNLRGRKFITDEMVLESYNSLKKQLKGFKERAKTEDEMKYLQELEISINDAYRILETEEKRKIYDEFLARIEQMESKNGMKSGQTTSTSSSQKRPSTQTVDENEVKFIPMYKGKFNDVPKKTSRQDDDAR